jgi:hypothetical protein
MDTTAIYMSAYLFKFLNVYIMPVRLWSSKPSGNGIEHKGAQP